MSISTKSPPSTAFDEETAQEIQNRARDYLDRLDAELDEERKKLGVSDELLSIDGMTLKMLVALGKDGIKSMEDFAGCAADDLIVWSERKNGETKKFPGIFSDVEISRTEAEAMIVQARLAAGWITEDDLAAEAEVEAGTRSRTRSLSDLKASLEIRGRS